MNTLWKRHYTRTYSPLSEWVPLVLGSGTHVMVDVADASHDASRVSFDPVSLCDKSSKSPLLTALQEISVLTHSKVQVTCSECRFLLYKLVDTGCNVVLVNG